MTDFFSSIRCRLLCLVLVALLPILGWTVYTDIEEGKKASVANEREALRVARLAAAFHETLMAENDRLLFYLAHLAMAEPVEPGCGPKFAEFLKTLSPRTDILVLTPEGKLLCGTPNCNMPTALTELSWFQKTLAEPKPAIFDYETKGGQTTGAFITVRPVFDAVGKLRLILTSRADFSWLADFSTELKPPAGTTISVRSFDGRLLVRHPFLGVKTGAIALDAVAGKTLAEKSEGSAESTGLDGVSKLFAFTRLRHTPHDDLYLNVGIPIKTIFMRANHKVSQTLISLVVVALLVLLVTKVISRILIIDQVKILVAATGRLTEGDLSTRIGDPYGTGELGQLAKAFDDMAATLEDRTARLHEAESRHRILVEQIPAVVYAVAPDSDCEFTYVSPQIHTLLGYSPEEWRTDSELRLSSLHAEDLKSGRQGIFCSRSVCDFDTPRHAEYRIQCRSGHRRAEVWVLDESFIVRDDAGHPAYIQGVVMDITALKEAQESIDALRLKIELILNSAGDGIFGMNSEGRAIFVNPAAAAMTGYDAEELEGKIIHDVIHCSNPGEANNSFKVCPISAALFDGKPHSGDDEYFTRKNGSNFPIEYVSTPTLERGVVTGTVVVFKDITSRRLMEEERLRLATAVHYSAESIIVFDPRFKILYVNPAFESLSGYGREEILGQDIRMLRSGKHDKDFFRNIQSVLDTGSPWKGRLTNVRKDGSFYEIEGTISPIGDGGGNAAGYVSVQRDTTREAKLEIQLRQAQKMEAIGTLAGGIAHDFNNILTAILGFTEITMDNLAEGTTERTNLEQVLNATHRAKNLVGQILAFSRNGEQERKPIRLSFLVKETGTMLRALLPSTIEIRQKINDNSDTILADPTQIHQVLMNLCTNAAHSMQGRGGIIEIEIAPVEIRSGETDGLEEEPSPGQYLRLTVSDTGHGMDHDILGRIFDPYFTTKGPGEGTGLGLSVVHGIVKSHCGFISVKSNPETGSTFQILFPQFVVENTGETEIAGPLPKGNERILFVDDEAGIAAMAQQMLERLGYHVTSAAMSSMALKLFSANPDAFHLVISDLTMPNMTGIELAQKIHAIRPSVPMILCTGYSNRIDRESLGAAGFADLVLKPLTRRRLAETVRTVLDEAYALSSLS